MLKRQNPTTTKAWSRLIAHFTEMENVQLTDLFNNQTDRFESFSWSNSQMLVDFSKNHITEETLSLLVDLAKEVGLPEAIDAMFNGEVINETENRGVLHTALRYQGDDAIYFEGKNVVPQVQDVLTRVERFSNSIHNGTHRGFTDKKIDTIVNIGIGGSDLGLFTVTEALKPYQLDSITTHFVSNVDGSHITETLKKINPETTLFIVASKSFSTQETMRNAMTARAWFLSNAKDEAHIAKHFVSVSTNTEKVKAFGIDHRNMFEFWSWVGGRYSLSSAIGLVVVLTIGFDNFKELQKGMYEMDEHFKNTPLDQNIPCLLAMIGVWYVNFYGTKSETILPYDIYLHRFAQYFQQVNMESNGKDVDRAGNKIDYMTGPVIWGEPGTNSQHSFFQLLHQGTQMIPCDFIASAKSHNPLYNHHEILLSNFFAQTEALMNGRSLEEVHEILKQDGISEEEIKRLAPFRVFGGNRPSNSILIKLLDPRTLGQLIALYEHKIFVQGIVWNIFSFDQWGVELGKKLANKILPELEHQTKVDSHDSSTNGLINTYKQWR